MKRTLLFLFAFFTLFVLQSCESDEVVTKQDPDIENPDPEQPQGKEPYMLVVNEGQWTKGTAAISVVYKDGSCDYDLFRKVNNRPIGDVAQSITYIGGKYYVVLNNSRKVEVVDAKTFESVATINYKTDGDFAPRFIAPISDTEAIVSDMNKVLTKINTTTNTIVEYITVEKPTEKLIAHKGKLFCMTGNSVTVYDCANVSEATKREVTGFLSTNTYTTAKPIIGKDGNVWVFTSGWVDGIPMAHFNSINPETEKVEHTFGFRLKTPTYDSEILGIPGFPRMDADREGRYIYLSLRHKKGVDENEKVIEEMAAYRFDTQTEEFICYRTFDGLGMMYGMGATPEGDIVVCDCLDYSAQRGYVRTYFAEGEVTAQKVGIYPRMVYFTEYNK